MLDVILSLSPVILIVILLIRNTAADISGWCGFALAVLIAYFHFDTPFELLVRASVSGFIASFPIALCIAASIFQIIIMSQTGALARIVASLKCLTPGTFMNASKNIVDKTASLAVALKPEDRITQLLILNFALGTMLTALGAVTISIFPPIMIALGYSVFVSIALPCIGYEAFCSYALLSVPAVVLGQLSGVSLNESATMLAPFMPYTAMSVALVMLWLAGGIKMLIKGLVPALLAGFSAGYACILVADYHLLPLTGIVAGLTAMLTLLAYELVRGRKLFDASMMNEADHAAVGKLSLLSAVSPWCLLVLVSLIINWPSLPLFKYFFNELAMPVEIFYGRPEKIRLFWQAYFWIFVTTVISVPFMKAKFSVVKIAGQRWFKVGLRPLGAAGVYFALAYVMNLSGYDASDYKLHNAENNMINILTSASVAVFQQYYALAAPYLGLMAGFISGSQTSSIAMLTTLHISAANSLGLNVGVVAAAGAIGGGLASLLSPAKLLSAAATIGKVGEEGAVLRACILPSLLLTALVAVLSWLWS